MFVFPNNTKKSILTKAPSTVTIPITTMYFARGIVSIFLFEANLKMKIPKFVFYTFAGSCVWSAGTILSGYYFGEAIGFGTSIIPQLP